MAAIVIRERETHDEVQRIELAQGCQTRNYDGMVRQIAHNLNHADYVIDTSEVEAFLEKFPLGWERNGE